MKKRLTLIMAAILVLCLLCACAAPADTQDAGNDAAADAGSSGDSAGAESARIGLTMNSFDSYQTIWYESFVKEAESLGMEVTVTNGDSDVETQISDVENFIANNMDLVVICAIDPDGVAPAVEACNEAGIAVVAAQHPVNAEFEARVMLGRDQTLHGLAQCQAIEAWMEKNPGVEIKAGYLQGAMGLWSAQERYDGFVDNLPEGAELVVANTANWNADEAAALVEDWLVAYPEINCIAAANDDMAVAAVNVLKTQGKTDFSDFLILGDNAQEDACEYIAEGSMYASVYYAQDIEAAFAADVCYAILQGVDFNGENIPAEAPEGILLPVTKDNVDGFKDTYKPVIPTLDELLAWND